MINSMTDGYGNRIAGTTEENQHWGSWVLVLKIS